jgi:hypothetical protein
MCSYTTIREGDLMIARKGMVLVITILSIGALFFFTFLLVRLYAQDKGVSLRGENDLVAEQAARAGIDDALFNLKGNTAWTAGFNNVPLPHSRATYSVSFNRNQAVIPFSTNNVTGASLVKGYNGRSVPPCFVHIVSTGVFENSRRIEETMISTGGGQLFSGGLFAVNSINLSGNVMVDSYNSSMGTYTATHMNSGGDIGTNSAASGAVDLSGHSQIYGTITLPTGANAATSIDNSGGVSYQSVAYSPPQNTPFLPLPGGLGASQGDLKVTGGTVTLSPGVYDSLSISGKGEVILRPGNYVFNGDIKLAGQGNISIPTGQVKFYANGENIQITGGGNINNNGIPGNFQIIASSATTEVKVAGDGQSFMALYAPGAAIEISGNGDIYGAVVGNKAEINGNAALHFDQSMKNISGGTGITVSAQW